MSQYSEGCKQLTSVTPLKQGEVHCSFCMGFGANPAPFFIRETVVNPITCNECNGTGKKLSKKT